MLNINTTYDGGKMNVELDGRLDTTTAPMLESELKEKLGNSSELVFDLQNLEYISSAGLRVLLAAQKIMNKQGSMCIKNVSAAVKDIFEVTGFSDILTII
jgi:anti-sigma B factor antagonist